MNRGKFHEGNIKKILQLNCRLEKNYNISNFNFFKYNWVLLNNDLATLPIPKVGCTTVYAQTICYHQDIEMNFDDIQYKHANEVRPSFFSDSQKYCVDKEKIHRKKFIIFRDPRERIISAWKNRFNDCTFEEFIINVDNTFRNYDINNIDQHINLQSNYYDFEEIDIFVELKDYPKFCEKYGIPWTALNQTVYHDTVEVSEFTEQLIRRIYAKDYELIERIKSSEKLWTC